MASHYIRSGPKSPAMSAATLMTDSDGLVRYASLSGDKGPVASTGDNDSDLLSVKPSNLSPLFSPLETADTSHWINKREGRPVSAVSIQGGRKRAKGAWGGHRVGPNEWGFVESFRGPRVCYPAEEPTGRLR